MIRVVLKKDERDKFFYHLGYYCGTQTTSTFSYVVSFHQDNLIDLANGEDTSWLEDLAKGEEVDVLFSLSEVIR